MKYTLFTRSLLVMLFLILFPQFFCAQELTLKEQLQEFIKDNNATVGIAVKKPGGEVISLNNENQYPMMSVFKFHLALAVLNHLEMEEMSMDMELKIREDQLLHNTYSPIKKKYPVGDVTLTIRELLYYTVSLSDNNGCDLLINFIGGTDVLDSYIRSLGIKDFSITVTEDDMHREFANQYQNWTTPEAAVDLMDIFLSRSLYFPTEREYLYNLLVGTTTGTHKLKAGLPEEVVLGHKTGSSFRGEEGLMVADNDLGFVVLPDGSYYCIGVFVKNSMEDDQTNGAIIAGVSRIVYHYMSEQYGKE